MSRIVAGVALLGLLATALPARAATITVDRTDDVTPVPAACTAAANDCTLRGAIQFANGAPATEITLPAGTYTLAAALEVTGSVMLVGAGAAVTIVDANLSHRVMVVRGGATAVLSRVTLTRGNGAGPDADGGAIKNLGTLSLVDAAVSQSASTTQGGGISNSGTVVLTRSVVAGNTATSEGGGIWNNAATLIARDSTIDGNHSTADVGGGISSYGAATTTLTGCTLSANTAGTLGGGLFSADFGATTLTNCTVSGNTAATSGGGIDAAGGTVTLSSVTVANNTGGTEQAGAGGGLAGDVGTLIAQNSVIAGNHDQNGSSPDCAGTIISQGYDLLGSTSGCTLTGSPTNVSGADPQLGPLADNGGPTQTHALPAGSAAVDTANPTPPGSGGNTCPDADQRGIVRPQPDGGRCDIGAFELATSSSTSTTVVTTSTSTSTTLRPVEICDDCLDNDGDGLTDLEDPTCCPNARLVVLALGKTLLKPGPSGVRFALASRFTKLNLTPGGVSTQDVLVQLHEADGADFLCARIPAANLVRRGSKETFKDPKGLVASARGIDTVFLKQRKDGSAVFKATGKRVSATLPPPGTLHVTVGILQPGAAEAANRCATVAVPFTANRKGALFYRNP